MPLPAPVPPPHCPAFGLSNKRGSPPALGTLSPSTWSSLSPPEAPQRSCDRGGGAATLRTLPSRGLGTPQREGSSRLILVPRRGDPSVPLLQPCQSRGGQSRLLLKVTVPGVTAWRCPYPAPQSAPLRREPRQPGRPPAPGRPSSQLRKSRTPVPKPRDTAGLGTVTVTRSCSPEGHTRAPPRLPQKRVAGTWPARGQLRVRVSVTAASGTRADSVAWLKNRQCRQRKLGLEEGTGDIAPARPPAESGAAGGSSLGVPSLGGRSPSRQ